MRKLEAQKQGEESMESENKKSQAIMAKLKSYAGNKSFAGSSFERLETILQIMFEAGVKQKTAEWIWKAGVKIKRRDVREALEAIADGDSAPWEYENYDFQLPSRNPMITKLVSWGMLYRDLKKRKELR